MNADQTPKPPEKPTSFLHIKCTPRDKAAWVRAAGSDGLQKWTTDTLNTAAQKQSGKT